MRLVQGLAPSLLEGFRLRRHARSDPRSAVQLGAFEPPDTPMVRAATAYLAAHCHPAMRNHSFRTAFRTLFLLHQRVRLTDQDIETTWVAALLHDVGLDVPPGHGDFSLAGVQTLGRLAEEAGWEERQLFHASQAIASNLSTHLDPTRFGLLAWAMNVGGTGEVTYGPHRELMDPTRAAELEERYPREGFRSTALRLITAEAERVPEGRFAFARIGFHLFLRP